MIAQHPSKLTFVAVALFVCAPAHSLSIDPSTWQEIVHYSDLVAIVECVTAGIIVAEYEIIEVWKGDASVGDEIRLLEIPTVYDGIPFALIGDRALIAGHYRSGEPDRRGMRSSLGHGMAYPLFARDIAFDYQLPLYEGIVHLPVAEGRPAGFGQFEGDSIEEFKRAVTAFLASPNQELLVLRSQVTKYLLIDLNPIESREPHFVNMQNKTDGAETVEELVDTLLEFAREARPSFRNQVVTNIIRGRATPAVARYILSLPPESIPVEENHRDDFFTRMREVLNPPPFEPGPPYVPPDDYVAARREALNDVDAPFNDFLEAIHLFLDDETDRVQDALLKWRNPDERYTDAGYVVGSLFTIYCPNQCASRFRALLQANDEWVRVAAAVYLTFEDEAAGLEQLEAFSALKSGAGAWAVLNRLRRGDKQAMPRMLDFLTEPYETVTMYGTHHDSLLRRFAVLMSNSAAHSDLPQPPPFRPSFGEPQAPAGYRQAIQTWWNQHNEALTLHDPWLDELRAQKVD